MLYGIIDAKKYGEEILPCEYSYMNPYMPENNGVIQAYSYDIEYFIDISGDIPKIRR